MRLEACCRSSNRGGCQQACTCRRPSNARHSCPLAGDRRQVNEEIFRFDCPIGQSKAISLPAPNASCTTVGNCGGAAGSIVSFNENILRAGINFKFGPW